MKKYRLFIVNTQYQLLNAVNLVANTPGYNDHLNDIIVHSTLSAIMPSNYQDSLCELFAHIFEVNCRHPEEPRLQQVNATCPAGLRRRLLCFRVKAAWWFLRRFVVSSYLKLCLGMNFSAANYREIYIGDPSQIARSLFGELYHRHGLRTLHILEDGTATYVDQRQAKFFAHKFKDLQIIFYLYAPDFVTYADRLLGKLASLPVLSRKNTAFLQYLNRLFGYNSDNILNQGIEFVILDQNIQSGLPRNSEQRKQVIDYKSSLYQLAADAFGSKLWLKVHPSYITNDSIEKYQFKNILMAPGESHLPFELLLLNAQKYPGIISIASTACFMPYLGMDSELADFRLIVLDRLFELNKLYKGCVNVDRFIDKLEAKYKFYRPRTVEEYRQILPSLSMSN